MRHLRVTLTPNLAITVIALMTLMLHMIFWHLPLLDLGALQTSVQDENFSDQNFYLYAASALCHASSWTSDDLYVTWSATGVVGYLAYGCEVFGTEYFYVILNPILIVMSFGLVIVAGRTLGLKPRIPLLSLISIPYTLLTLSLPGKEIISMAGTMSCVAGLMLLECSGKRALGFLAIAAGIALIAVNRMHEAGAMALFVVLWLTGTIKSPISMLVFFAAASYFANGVLGFVGLDQKATSLTDEVLWSGSSEGKSVDLDGISDLLRSDNFFLHALLGVLRVLAVLASPLSSLVTPATVSDFSYFIFRDLSQRLRLIDLILIVYVIYLVAASPKYHLPIAHRRLYALMPLLFLFMIYVISFFGISQKSRYIFQYTPLLLLWLWLFAPNQSPKISTTEINCQSQPEILRSDETPYPS